MIPTITVLAESKENPVVKATIDLPVYNGGIKELLKNLAASSENEITLRYAGTKKSWSIDAILMDNLFEGNIRLQELNLLAYILERMDGEQIAKLDGTLHDRINDCSIKTAVNAAYDVIAQAAGCHESLTYYNGDNITEVIKAERLLRNPYPEMDKDVFWRMIDEAYDAAGEIWQDMNIPLAEALSKLEEPDIIRFKLIFDEYKNLAYKEKLWAAAAIMHDGCSDDGFIDFRAWLIAQGKDVYMKALHDPDSLADLTAVKDYAIEIKINKIMPPDGYFHSADFEGFNYVANDAYKISVGGDSDIYDAIDGRSLSKQEKADIAGEITYAEDIDVKWGGLGASWKEISDTLEQMLPNLHKVFYEAEAPEAVITPKPTEKESVIEKIRQSKQKAEPDKSKNKNHGKGGPEL